jgi:transposase
MLRNSRSRDLAADRPERTSDRGRYSDELRTRVIAALEQGASGQEVAARFGVSAGAAAKWLRRYRRSGSVADKPRGGDHRSRLLQERDWILRRIAAAPELTLIELHRELCARGVRVGYPTVRRFVARERIALPADRSCG